jgi:ABC-type glycerol-3-phosphate transport system permease component
MLALSFTTSPAHQTVPVGIANFTGLYNIPWGDMAAASVVVTVPLVVLVLIFQRRIVEGVTAGAVKA